MRKPRDFDSELKALSDKARHLKERKVVQLGELVIACGADALTVEQLAGALLDAADGNAATKEGWRKRGAAFFQRAERANASSAAQPAGPDAGGPTPGDRESSFL